MNPSVCLVLAAVSSGLLTDSIIATFAVLGGAAGFVSLAITLLRGRMIAGQRTTAIEPRPAGTSMPVPQMTLPASPRAPARESDDSVSVEVMALISAAVALTLGKNARIASVMPVAPPSVELLQQWSIEGRRQIYSSHQIR